MESNSPGQNSTWDNVNISRTPRIIFLTVFMAASFAGSLFIIIVLAHNIKLRSVQNLLIASMCTTCIIDCIVNMAIVMGSLISNEWVYGDLVCKVNHFFMTLVAVKTVLMLAAFSTDRYFSLRFGFKYEAWLSSCRIWSVIAYMWLHSLVFSIPCLTEAVPSTFRPQINMCTVTGETSLTFLSVTLIVCFLGPLTIITVVHVFSFRLSCKLRYLQRNEAAEKHYTQMRKEYPQISQHAPPASYTVILVVLWLALEIPLLVTSYVKQYEYSKEPAPGSKIDYSWQVSAAFVWMRFFFSAVFPFVTFFCKKDIWQSAKECVLCRRHNSIVDMDAAGCVIARKNDSLQNIEKEVCTKGKDRDKDHSETPSSLTFNVPVLFATSTGICIEDSSTGYSLGESDCTASTTDMLQLKGKALDISYPSYEYPDELMGDTSDYDSSCEIDQYSSSQPVSTRNVLGILHRTRSTSDPEISARHGKTKAKDTSKDLTVTGIADSGLDLSGTGTFSLGGTIQSQSKVTNGGVFEARNSPLPETAADTDAENCHERCLETLVHQSESTEREVCESCNTSSSHMSAHNCPSGILPPLDIQQKKHKTIKRDNSSSESSPQKTQSNFIEENNSSGCSATQRRSDKLSHSKVNIEQRYSVTPNNGSGHKRKQNL